MKNRTGRRKNQRNKKPFYLIIGIIAAVLVAIAIFFGYNYWRNEQRKEQANQTALAFVEALENQEYEELTSFISNSSIEEIGYTKEEVQERYTTIYDGIGVNEVAASHVEVVEENENDLFRLNYTLDMTTALGDLSAQTYITELVETEDGFTVNWDPSLIFPEMETGDTVRIEFQTGKRGNLLDRNGDLLAGEGTAWEAGLYPALLGEGEERAENLQTIADTFDVSIDELENVLSASWVTEESFVPFKMVDDNNTPEVNGVMYQETTARTYPLGEAAAHLIGYVGEVFAEDIEEDPTLQAGDIIGKSGLEATFDERLRGSRGGEITILDDAGETRSIIQEAPVENGEDIQLTIDSTLQEEYYTGFNDESGAAVVTEPHSGELLVLTSSPSYDPTLMTRGISNEEYQNYVEDEETPFLPRYTARYAPASTFKVITAAIGLDSGATTLDETHTITGLEWQKDESWGNYKVTRVSDQPTEVNLEDALVYSDNIFFAREALEMGPETFMNGLTQFPFGESFNLPISMQPAQITNSGSFDSEMLMVDTAFGQGQLLMSPLHQAVFYSPFANGGELIAPKIELNADNQETIQPISQETAETVKSLLTEVVNNPNGTAHTLSDASTSLAAKTGTAEVQDSDSSEDTSTNGFLLAFDAENNSFLSLILIENNSGAGVVDQFAPVLNQQ